MRECRLSDWSQTDVRFPFYPSLLTLVADRPLGLLYGIKRCFDEVLNSLFIAQMVDVETWNGVEGVLCQ